MFPLNAAELQKKINVVKQRKEDGIRLCLEKPTQAKTAKTLFEGVHLINNSLPELDFGEIDASTKFLGHKFSAPILIGAMTGGAELAKKINRNLARACQETGIGMVVGSQRAALLSKGMRETYAVTRDEGPDIFIGANVGGAQMAKRLAMEEANELIDMIRADALYIHLNPLQELIQPEGEPAYRGVLPHIRDFSKSIKKPIVVKEVGIGLSGDVAKRLETAGVDALEIAGTGGTSWVGVETYRAKEMGDDIRYKTGLQFWDWGIPTAASLLMCRSAVKLPLVSSGGIRTGLDVAKSIAMGASLGAAALPFLRYATESSEKVVAFINELIFGLKTAMFATGCKNIAELSKTKYVLTGDIRAWNEAIG